MGGAQRQLLELKPELKLVISIYPQADAGSAVTEESQLIQKFTAINTEINTAINNLLNGMEYTSVYSIHSSRLRKYQSNYTTLLLKSQAFSEK